MNRGVLSLFLLPVASPKSISGARRRRLWAHCAREKLPDTDKNIDERICCRQEYARDGGPRAGAIYLTSWIGSRSEVAVLDVADSCNLRRGGRLERQRPWFRVRCRYSRRRERCGGISRRNFRQRCRRP